MDLSDQTQVAEAAQTIAGRDITVPLKLLERDKLNVRKKSPARSVEELAALIHSQGLLQNLVVRPLLAGKKTPKPSGRYGVVAGGRRLEALNLLFTQGKVGADFAVRCLEVSQEDALSVSLAENCAREPLHNADLFDAMFAMVEQGKNPVQIANAWGLSVLTVERRLKLAKVSPKLMALYREDQISLEQMMALTLVDEHATQEAVWFNAPAYERSALALRRRLTERDVPATHPLARFVGFENYEAAGGAVRRDLFADDEAAPGYITDTALLARLASERLEREAEVVRAEGWPWVEVRTSFGYSDQQAFAHCRTLDVDPTEEQQQRLDAIEALVSELEGRIDNLDPEADSEAIDALEAQQREAEAEREAIEQTLQQIDPRDLPLAGVVVYVDQQGELAVLRGLVRAQDRKAQVAAAGGQGTAMASGSAGATTGKASRPDYSERLLRQLTAHRTAALRATLADRPAAALRVLAYQLALQTGLSSRCCPGDRPVEIRADCADVRKEGADLAECRAQQAMEAHRERLSELLPGDQRALLAWVLKANDAQVLDLLAACTASTLNTVQGRESPQPIADAIAAAVNLDMADWWEPRADYLGAVPKSKIIDAVREAVSPSAAASLEGLKKGEAVAQAQQLLQGKRWLPPVLRAKG